MPVSLSSSDLLRAYEALGVSVQEFDEIEKAPYPKGDEQLRILKARVSKAIKRLAKQMHPDVTDDPKKIELFQLAARVAKDISKRTARPDLPQMTGAHLKSAPISAAKPPLRVNMRRAPVRGGNGARDMAVKIAKMRP